MEDSGNFPGVENEILEDEIGTQAYDIADAERDIALLKRDKADRSVTDNLTGRVTVMERDKANQSDMTNVTGRVTVLERDKASRADLTLLGDRVDGLSGRTTDVEIKKADRTETAALREDVTDLTLGKADKAYVDAGLAAKAEISAVTAQGLLIADLQQSIGSIMEKIYPVGSYYFSSLSLNPASFLSFGVWRRSANGKVLVGVDESDEKFPANYSGGSKYMQKHDHENTSHKHTVDRTMTNNAGAHTHNVYYGYNGLSHGGRLGGQSCGGTGAIIGQASNAAISSGAHIHEIPSCATNESGNSRVSISGEGECGNLQPYLTCYIWERIA